VTAVAVIAVGGVVFGHAIAHGQAPHSAVAAPEPPAVQAPVIPPPTPAPAPSPAPKPPKARHPRVKPAALSVTDVGSACYIQVTSAQGDLIVRKILQPGQHLAFRHHGLRVVLGNAGGVRISIDGHRAHRAGRPGQVRSFRVG
jgi:cytoskeleton protein RodZ